MNDYSNNKDVGKKQVEINKFLINKFLPGRCKHSLKLYCGFFYDWTSILFLY
jgi:hypothetical protein